MHQEFAESIRKHQIAFDLNIPENSISQLADYYELICKQNDLLHLVAPISAGDFATRHILESLTLLRYLPKNGAFVDVGPGAGLPSIPCLIVRDDLRAQLVESKIKKSSFLVDALNILGLQDRSTVINKQFEEAVPDGLSTFVACRALDKFTEKLPRLIKWSNKRGLLLFGGPRLKTELGKYRSAVKQKLIPLSDRRYLYICT